ncbi:MAG: hypothetical protein LBH74_09935 [Nitrososphaerota archaeon]|nr:hypothetical protein [Nitrososphaerota archaeon]
MPVKYGILRSERVMRRQAMHKSVDCHKCRKQLELEDKVVTLGKRKNLYHKQCYENMLI